MLIHWVQSSGFEKVTSHRYCLIHWFLHLKRPSVYGWNAVNRFWESPSLEANTLPKCEVNLGY